jgi:hypothetical protein
MFVPDAGERVAALAILLSRRCELRFDLRVRRLAFRAAQQPCDSGACCARNDRGDEYFGHFLGSLEAAARTA